MTFALDWSKICVGEGPRVGKAQIHQLAYKPRGLTFVGGNKKDGHMPCGPGVALRDVQGSLFRISDRGNHFELFRTACCI